MSEMKNSLDSIKVDLMKGLNDGMDRNDKLALASNLRGVRETIFDLTNVRAEGEYVFAGSDTTIQTMVKDADYEENGKVTFEGDSFLRKIAVQPGSYRDRGVTAYDVGFYTASSAKVGEELVVADNERIIDSEGHEWKISTDRLTMQRYDHNGAIFHPTVEIPVYTQPAEVVTVDLGIEGNTNASGVYAIQVGTSGTTYEVDADAVGIDTADDVFQALRTQLVADGYSVPSSLRNLDQFTISHSSYDEIEINIDRLSNTANYNVTISTEQEAEGDSQAVHGQVYATIPNSVTTADGEQVELGHMFFESKHNYFDDLNVIINALEGYSTHLDGTKADEMTDDGVDDTLRTALEQTSNQFDATNIGHGELGGRNKVFELSFEKLESQITHYNILLQETNGADFAKLAMESKQLEMTYQALYSTITKMNDLSLVNFIR
jgi:flagellar hook-associated protein 3 FlgL